MFIKKFNGKNAILVTVLSATMVFLAGCDNKIVNFTDELKHINIPEETESVSETEENESESTTEPEGTVEPESTEEIESTDVPETENTEEVEPDNTAEPEEETGADNDVDNATESDSETDSVVTEEVEQFTPGWSFKEDRWKFDDYDVGKLCFNEDIYNEENFPNIVEEYIRDKKNKGASGQSFGMALYALNESEKVAISSIEKDEEIKQKIGDYFIKQYMSPTRDNIAYYHFMSDRVKKEKLEELLPIDYSSDNGLRSGTEEDKPVFMTIYDTNAYGRAVIAFEREKCNDGDYEYCISLYDFKDAKKEEPSRLYYNDDYDKLYSAEGDEYSIGLITNDVEQFTSLQEGTDEYSYIGVREGTNVVIESGEEIRWEESRIDAKEYEKIVKYYDIDAKEGSEKNFAIKEDDAGNERPYTISSEDGNLDVFVSYNNYYMGADVDGAKSVNFSADGKTEIAGEVKDTYMFLTCNLGSCPTNSQTIKLKITNGKDISLTPKVKDECYILEGENLENITITFTHDNITNEAKLEEECGNEVRIKMSSNKGPIVVQYDINKDGVIDAEEIKELKTDTTETTPTPSESVDTTDKPKDDKSEEKGRKKIIAVALVGGFSVMAVVAIIIIVALSAKKSKQKDEHSISVNAVKETEAVDAARPMARATNSDIGIRILSGIDSGRAYRFMNKNVLTIGKDPRWSDVVVDKKFLDVSRRQCIVEYNASEDRYYVTDCSTNGTLLEDGTKIRNGEKRAVRRGTVLKLSSSRFKIKLM